jgi:hypothetical protein
MNLETLIGSRVFVEFTIEEVDEYQLRENDGYSVAFVPNQGYQYCKYHTGTKTWKSMITKEEVTVSHILMLMQKDE